MILTSHYSMPQMTKGVSST